MRTSKDPSSSMPHTDASIIVVNICMEGSCTSSYVPADGRTTFYQSRDGGVTWEHLVSFDNPWKVAALLPSGSDETRLLLRNANSFDYMLWPGDLSITPPDPPEGHDILGVVLLSDGRITWGMNNNTSSLPIFLAENREDLTELVVEQLTPECPSCSMASRWSSLGKGVQSNRFAFGIALSPLSFLSSPTTSPRYSRSTTNSPA